MFKEVILFSLISVFLGLSQTAGVGGGPIVNMCLMISMGYDAKLSISITYVFLIGGSIASIWKNAVKKNPDTGRSYVDLNLILLTIPMMTSGSLFGGVVKNFVSEAIITIMFIILFIYLIYDLRKALRRIQDERNASLLALKSQIKQSRHNDIFQQKYQQAIQTSSPDKLALIFKMFAGYYIVTVFISLVRGGLKYDSIIGINPCGFSGFFILLLHLALSAFVSVKVANFIISQSQQPVAYTNRKNVQINKDNVWYFILVGFCAGLMGSTLAIGGALILIPVWLKFGVNKDVAASSTATLILLGAMVAFTIALFNHIYQDISSVVLLLYLVLAFASAAIVKDILTYLTNKYQLKSLVIVLLLVVVVFSLLVMIPYQTFKLFTNPQKFISFGQLC